jgi:hypothetical protein
MKIDVSHTKNSLTGWDIKVAISAETGESIASINILVNDFPQLDERLDPPVGTYTRTLTQQGEYPGDNKTLVTVYDQNCKESNAEDVW